MKKILLGLAMLSMAANAILLERSQENAYNSGVKPKVDYELLSKVRKDLRAPQADDVFIPRVYTHNNNTSEYLRDELGLPREVAQERLNQYDSTYVEDPKIDALLKKRVNAQLLKAKEVQQFVDKEK